jgi:hypothetical protein
MSIALFHAEDAEVPGGRRDFAGFVAPWQSGTFKRLKKI